MRFHNRFRLLAVGGMIGLLAISQAVPSSQAQTTNITSSGLGTKITQAGNTYNIEGGTRPLSSGLSAAERSGANVFHSFGRFDLGAGNIANFIRPDAAATTVISRVTGGVPSNINGTIQALGWSNFYFINSSGVVFGPSAALNVSGSAYISTAQNVRFVDQGFFNTQFAESRSSFSSYPVSSFGFLRSTAAPITIVGSSLTVPLGKTLSVIGGHVTIEGAQLKAPGGTVQVASVGYGGEVFVEGKPIFAPSSDEIIGYAPGFETAGPPGSITMNPGTSFASLEAETVQAIPTLAKIETPVGSQKIIRPSVGTPNLVKVVTAPILNTISPNITLEEGQITTVTIALNKPAEITESVTLSNSNAGAATTVPSGPTITFNPGEQTKTVQVTGVKEGSTQITATLRNLARSTAIAVMSRLAFSGTLTPTVELGLNGTLTISLNRTSSTPTDVTLSSLTPGVATLNTTKVTIPAGQTSSAPIEVKSADVGTATIRASLNGVTVDRSMQITPMSLVSMSGVSILEGQTGAGTVTIPRNAPSTVRISLQLEGTNIATLDNSFVNIQSGTNSATFTIRGVTEGTARLRAQSGTSTQTAAVVVNALPPPPLSSLSPNLVLKVGGSDSIVVVLKETFKKDLTVLLRSSDPSIASVNEVVNIPANSTTSNPIVVTATGVGRTTIVASLPSSSVQALVDVTSPGVVLPPGANGTIGLSSAVQYPRPVAAPQGSVAVARLLADKCAAVKDGQFSSFAQLNRDSAPPQPGRYLSAPTLLEGDPLTSALETVPQLSIIVGPPKLLTVHPDVGNFIALAQDCRIEIK